MSAVQATGRVVRDREGLELIVERRVAAPSSEVWEWLTVPARLRKWIGAWKGRPAVGGTIEFTMLFEEGATAETVTILDCVPAERFSAEWAAGGSNWRMGFSLAEVDGATRLYLAHRLSDAREAGSVGPGWEYYLDRMIAARAGAPLPEFADYYPVQRPYYERLAMDGDPVGWPGT
ncbi:MAG: ATPase [Microbacteriaceae bacterium]|nr:ATPase [Microbacteriaceae bacterium]